MHWETGVAGQARRWYVAYTEPRKETFAQGHLDRQGYETYLPLYGRVEPMFPRYLFFRPAHANHSIAPVRSTRGVQSVVRFGSVYAQVPEALMAAIREQASALRARSAGASTLQPGQRVRIQGAAAGLEGMEGLVHSSAAQRVIVLMEILGRQTPVKLRAENLEVV